MNANEVSRLLSYYYPYSSYHPKLCAAGQYLSLHLPQHKKDKRLHFSNYG